MWPLRRAHRACTAPREHPPREHPSHRAPGSSSRKRLLGRDWPTAYLFVALTVLLLATIKAYPFLRALWFSLHNVVGFRVGNFVGLDNYITLPGLRYGLIVAALLSTISTFNIEAFDHTNTAQQCVIAGRPQKV